MSVLVDALEHHRIARLVGAEHRDDVAMLARRDIAAAPLLLQLRLDLPVADEEEHQPGRNGQRPEDKKEHGGILLAEDAFEAFADGAKNALDGALCSLLDISLMNRAQP